VTLSGSRKYTVNTYALDRWPLVVLSRPTSSQPADLIYFDVFDVDTNAAVSRLPALAVSLLDPRMDIWFPRAPYKENPYTRDNFVEFEPQTTVKGFEIDSKECEPEWLLNKVLRIERPEDRLHQRLGIHLRRRIALWSSKTTDELFEGGKETIMTKGEVTIPLEVTPEDYAESTIVE
jgi:hypothetical protein